MAIRELADLTWEEIRDLDPSRTIAVLPVGAIEAHGPHLPLGTDVVIARAMAEEGAIRMEAQGRPGNSHGNAADGKGTDGKAADGQGFRALLLPALGFTAAPFAAGFPGTLSVSPTTLVSLLIDIARELTRQRFAALAIANGHLDPAHRSALASAAAQARQEGLLPVICPDVTRKPWALRLTTEFKSGACHAGRYEGSIVLAARPELVRDEVRKQLPPNPASLSEAIQRGAHSFEEAGGPRAYFGWPAEATAEEGRATIAALGAILCEAVLGELVRGTAA